MLSVISKKNLFLAGGVLLATISILVSTVGATPLLQLRPPANPVLFYQGRLLKPNGDPQANGNYSIVFSLYDVDVGGGALWAEAKQVSVTDGGLFHTLLGDTNSLDLGLFDGRRLWLGVKIEADEETTPRQLLAHAPYAIHAEDAATVGGQPASDFAQVGHDHDGRYFVKGSGTQFNGVIAPGVTQNWFTHSWDPNQLVIWSVRPTTVNGRISYSVEIERGSNNLLTYWIIITNVGSITTDFEAQYRSFN